MNKFRKVNLKYLRERAATLQNSGQSLNQFYQFMPLQSDKWSPFAAIISLGGRMYENDKAARMSLLDVRAAFLYFTILLWVTCSKND